MKKNNQVDIPLFFFFCAFGIVIVGLFSRIASQKSFQKIDVSQKTNISPTQKSASEPKALNYNLPIICNYQAKEASFSAALINNSLKINLLSNTQETKYILEGDCLYSWGIIKGKGMKKCAMGNYIALGRQFLSSGLGSVDSLLQIIPNTNTTSTLDIQGIVKSCQNVKDIKKELFLLPTGVKFE